MVSRALLWKTDSSVDLRYDIRVYEGETPFTDELDVEERGIKNIPQDQVIDRRKGDKH